MFIIPAKARTQRKEIWAPAFARVTIWALLLAIFFAVPATAQTFPKLTGRVVDDAHLLTAEQVQDLTSKSAALEASKGAQLVIATVPSLQGYPIEDFGYRLGRAWGIGQKGKDNGVILLVAPNEHKVRIEVGYGATPYLTDAMSGLIIRQAIIPHFKQSPPDYSGGIEAGADQIVSLMSMTPEQAEQAAAQAQQQEQAHRTSSGGALPIIFWAMIFVFIILSKFRRIGGKNFRSRRGGISPWVVLWGLSEAARASRGGGWGGGGFGGGGGGFAGFSGGGGGFGGGGASGSW